MSVRKIIKIDEDLCDGCGECVPSCAEGAIQIIDGKARLMGENLCDGLGACLGDCPQNALLVIEREADEFDEAAVEQHMRNLETEKAPSPAPAPHPHAGGCPSARVVQFDQAPKQQASAQSTASGPSGLGHWPIKMRLVPPGAPFLKGKDLVLAADCVGFAYAATNQALLPGNAVLIGCPKFDDPEADLQKLTEMLSQADIKSLTVAHMEVPCCHGYVYMAQQAIKLSGKDIPFKRIELTLDGKVKPTKSQSIMG
jgi:NAD-dependent dihydropyrimidine dehydrogenase PreA subunit